MTGKGVLESWHGLRIEGDDYGVVLGPTGDCGDGDDGDVFGLQLAKTVGDLAQLQCGQGSVMVNAGGEVAEDRRALLRQST